MDIRSVFTGAAFLYNSRRRRALCAVVIDISSVGAWIRDVPLVVPEPPGRDPPVQEKGICNPIAPHTGRLSRKHLGTNMA